MSEKRHDRQDSMTRARKRSEKGEAPLWALAWPIALELLLQYAVGAADTLMMSAVSDRAAAAVGVSNQVLHSFNMLFLFVNAGAGIVMAVHWGAGRREAARHIAALAIRLNLIIGIVLGVGLYAGKDAVLQWMQTPPEAVPDARIYLGMVGSGTALVAVSTSAAASIRSTGDTRSPMAIAVLMNATHLVLNYALIFGEFGFPRLGTAGVALSTLISRSLAAACSLWLLRRLYPGFWRIGRRWSETREALKEVAGTGWPITMSNGSFAYVQTVIVSMISSIGVVPLAAYTYMNSIQGFPTMLGSALGLAAQIRIGQSYGAGRENEAHRLAYQAVWIGWGAMSAVGILIFAFREDIIGLYTKDAEIAALAMPIFALYLLLQPLKMQTMGFAQSLYAVGDNRKVTYFGIVSMWLLGAGVAWLFAIRLERGLLGVYAAMLLDEGARATFAWLRWRNRRKQAAK